jgi:hypothetical protein
MEDYLSFVKHVGKPIKMLHDIVTCMNVSIDGVWINDRMYWTV